MEKTPIKLNGTTFYLRYDLNALAFIEENLGIGIQSLDAKNIGARTLLVCVYAGLIWDRKNCPTRWDVGSWIVTMEDFNYAADQFAKALDASLADPKKREKQADETTPGKEEKADDRPNGPQVPSTGP